ncbi:conjugal transfer protein TrbI [Candidatus Magnetomorum sp. HK-1]|nr:conjugal transfer protein TrbI [Candidatus Magnetomorum sp. HK-1]
MLENINPQPSGVRKINKRMVVSTVFFISSIVLVIIFLMTLAEKKSIDTKSVSQEDSGYISQKKINVQSLHLLPDKYSDIKPQPRQSSELLSQKSTPKQPPDKVFLSRSTNNQDKKAPFVDSKTKSPKKVSTQQYLPYTPGHDIRPGANYQHQSPEQIEEEKAFKSKLMFFGSGEKKIKQNMLKERQIHRVSESGEQKQAMINDLIDRINPNQDISETRTNQRSKQTFFHSQDQGAIHLNQRIQDPVSPYQLMAGTVLPAVLISGINSDLPGHIIAQIRENVFDTVHGRYLLVPQGTKLLGSYDNMVSWGQDKVMLVWSRLIMPDGATIALDNMPGVDVMGYAGLKDRVNNHYMKIAGAILMSTFLSVGTRHIAGEVNDNDPTIGQEFASEVSSDVNRAGQKIVTRHLNVPPTLEIRPGFPFNVMVNKDIILRPYEQ